MIVIDLEMTCCDGGEFPDSEMEVLEIGAVRVNGPSVSEFSSVVKPLHRPQLTPFCVQLLGISQAEVDLAPTFAEAWSSFLSWLGTDDAFCSWGRGDLRWLKSACLQDGVRFPFRRHCDLFRVFHSGQRRLLKRHGLSWSGTRHRALNDARTYVAIIAAEKKELIYREI